ncbi:AraC family transcriptional regulator [Tetragenococcus halophilus]|uniref:AraC family transcriptional regulator n=1 Tax=Tetragenococcus halophilus TaxID=51669 RepID=UPI002A98DB4C|nr:helix-turn-helix domain-containing protein [Tetragenococcus halophilus]
MNKEIIKKIFQNTSSEEWHLQHPGKLSPSYTKIPTKNHHGQEVFWFDFVNTFKRRNLGMIKETRYTTIPPHLHKDMELNYVYSGECTFVINGKQTTLKKGDICILDTNVVNSAKYKNYEDIVFNIVFQKDFFSSTLLAQFSEKDTLGEFLLNAFIKKQVTDNYFIFHTSKITEIKNIFDLIIKEHYFPEANSISIMEHYCSILFLYLTRLASDKQNLVFNTSNQKVLSILQEIEKVDGNCTLTELTKAVHFSPSTIYNLLKDSTGKSFSQIKLEYQMKGSKKLLTKTTLPILDIMEKVGIKNTTFFYEKFKLTYGKTPSMVRKENHEYSF